MLKTSLRNPKIILFFQKVLNCPSLALESINSSLSKYCDSFSLGLFYFRIQVVLIFLFVLTINTILPNPQHLLMLCVFGFIA